MFASSVLTLILLGFPSEQLHREEATRVARIFGREIASSTWDYTPNDGSLGALLTRKGIHIIVNLESGVVSYAYDREYTSLRMRERPGQGRKFTTLAGWQNYTETIAQRVWPGIRLRNFRLREKGESKARQFNRWSSDTNMVSVGWTTEPYAGYFRRGSFVLDRESGRLISFGRSKRLPVQ